MNEFLSKLSACLSTSEILDLLLSQCALEDLGIKAVRYYRLRVVSRTEYLVSVDCAGHEGSIPTHIRLGQIAKERRKRSEHRTDGSFDVIDGHLQKPVVFQIEPDLEEDIKLIHRYPLPYYVLKADGCDHILGPGNSRDAWADVPLTLAGRVCGKLSCSLELGRFPTDSHVGADTLSRLLRFQRLVTIVAPYVECLRAFDVNSPLEEASREIFCCNTYAELYRYLTKHLRELSPFDYEAADILVTTWDTVKRLSANGDRIAEDDAELLVLRDSSYPLAIESGWIDREYYRKSPGHRPWLNGRSAVDADDRGDDGVGITPWVWRTKQPVRLNEVEDDPRFEKQLLNYGPKEELTWAAKVQGAESTKSLLIVPIFDPQDASIPGRTDDRRVIGVIRFINRRRRPDGSSHIEPREEVLLRRIADRCIGPKIRALRHEVFTDRLINNIDKLVLVRPGVELSEQSEARVSKHLEDSINHLFDVEGTVFLLNLKTTDGTGFRPHVIHNRLVPDLRHEDRYDLASSLTGYILDSEKRYVFVNDLRYAEHRGFYQPIVPGALCALGSAVRFGSRDYGAFVILSDRFNILPGTYGRVVYVIAQQIGQLMKRMEIADFVAPPVKGVAHDVPTINEAVMDEDRAFAYGGMTKGDALLYANSLIKAYAIVAPPEPLVYGRRQPFDVLLNLSDAIRHSAEMALLVADIEAWRDRPWRECFEVRGQVSSRIAVSPHILDCCLLNLFKNAIMNCNPETPITVDVSVGGDSGDLVVKVTNRLKRRLDDASRAVFSANAGHTTTLPIEALFQDKLAQHIGLRLVRTLARWSAVNTPRGTRTGDLMVEEGSDGNHITCTLRLPLCQEPEVYDNATE